MLAVRHERDEITCFRERRDVVASTPAVFHEASVCRRPSARLSLVHDCDADLVTRLVKRARRIFVPAGEPVTIGNVDILDVELDSPVVVRFAQRDHRFDRAASCSSISKKLSQPRLLKPFIRKERHDLHIVLPRKVVHSLVERTPHDAKTIDDKYLWPEHGDLIDVLDERVVTVFAIDIVEQSLRSGLRSYFCRDCNKCEADQYDPANHVILSARGDPSFVHP